jgi:UDP-glucose 4-epimerase
MRVLVTGASSRTARRLVDLLRTRPWVESVLASRHDEPGELHRLIAGADIDTVVELRPRPERVSRYASCGLRKLIVKSSVHYYGFDPGAPAFLSEATTRSRPPRGQLERQLVAVETAAEDVARRDRECTVTVLRFADELGTGEGAHQFVLRLPFVPSMLGFDPRWQLIHEHDVVGVLAHATLADLRGAYNAAADGVLSLSEIASLMDKPLLPVLPPLGVGLAAGQMARLGLRTPVELLGQLRLGRGVDNRRLKASGYAYRYTSREAVLQFAEQQRLRPLLEAPGEQPTG